ncbi:hypothetical protein KAX02_13590 [candidate division WOR-3 bacterium]|nr:hypothetical protein [candidate division WOR-3 bacterium]
MTSQRPRLSIDLTPRHQEFLQRLPFGWKQQLFSVLIEMLIEMTDRCGMEALGVIAAKRIKLEDYFEGGE